MAIGKQDAVRHLTSELAAALSRTPLADQARTLGIHYYSKHGTQWSCWAVWLQHDRWDEALIDAGCGRLQWWQYPASVLRELLSSLEERMVVDADSAGLVQTCVPHLRVVDVVDAVSLWGVD